MNSSRYVQLQYIFREKRYTDLESTLLALIEFLISSSCEITFIQVLPSDSPRGGGKGGASSSSSSSPSPSVSSSSCKMKSKLSTLPNAVVQKKTLPNVFKEYAVKKTIKSTEIQVLFRKMYFLTNLNTDLNFINHAELYLDFLKISHGFNEILRTLQ